MGMRGVGVQNTIPRHFRGLIGNGESSSSGSRSGSEGEASDHGGMGESDYVYPEGGEWSEDR